MAKFKKILKQILYIGSVILPLIDTIEGIIKGISAGIEDAAADNKASVDQALKDKIDRGVL